MRRVALRANVFIMAGSSPPKGRFAGRRVILTGGGRGIGEATARRFASEGGDVLLVARTTTEIDAVAASIVAGGGAAWAHAADVGDSAQVDLAVEAARERWGGIDVLVNCAGVDHDCPFLQFPAAEWERVLRANLTGAFLMAQRAANVMAGGGGGAIVHVSSIDAYGADGNQVAYNASKAGMLGLSRTMAMELARHGIRSNVVAPGYTATPLTRQYVGDAMYEYMTKDFDRIPQRRMATPAEIAAAIAFLASDDAAAITGSELVVDGGTIANLYVVETLPGGT
jgi:NAD(P)-dependent dehydrogenase (short-subunit alcohol dehydrogenase family)